MKRVKKDVSGGEWFKSVLVACCRTNAWASRCTFDLSVIGRFCLRRKCWRGKNHRFQSGCLVLHCLQSRTERRQQVCQFHMLSYQSPTAVQSTETRPDPSYHIYFQHSSLKLDASHNRYGAKLDYGRLECWISPAFSGVSTRHMQEPAMLPTNARTCMCLDLPDGFQNTKQDYGHLGSGIKNGRPARVMYILILWLILTCFRHASGQVVRCFAASRWQVERVVISRCTGGVAKRGE